MLLAQQVVSLELAKKMKELGFEQDSLFYWSKPFDVNNYFTGDELIPMTIEWLEYHEMESALVYSAYTVAELGEMLPKYWTYHFQKSEKKENTYFDLVFEGDGTTTHWWGDETEADARAKMLILLKENNLI